MKSACILKSASLSGALFIILGLAVECSAESFQPDSFAVEAGVSAMRFNYAEYKDDGSTWDRERGNIPGLSLKFALQNAAWEWEGAANYHYGRADYTGQTNLGAPYNTRTDEGVVDFSIRAGRWLNKDYLVMPYAGWGYRQWNRDIRPASLAGLYEVYRWQYAWLGAKFAAYRQGATDVMLDLGWIRPINPTMQVNVYKANLNLGSRNGLRLLLTSNTVLPQKIVLVFEPYYEYWELGRSSMVTSSGGVIYEPASKTRSVGLNLRFGKMF